MSYHLDNPSEVKDDIFLSNDKRDFYEGVDLKIYYLFIRFGLFIFYLLNSIKVKSNCVYVKFSLKFGNFQIF